MMCLHLDEWLDLVRKQARYDKLGFGKKSRHMQRLTTFWFDWYNTVTATKFLRKMQIRDDNRRTREAFEHWTILIHAIRHKKQMELLGTRAWMDSVNGEMGTVVKVWRDYVNQRRESLARNEVLNRRYWSHNQRDIFTLWKRQTLEGRKERHILQTIVHRILFKEANATFRRWVEVVRFSKRAERIMSSWVVHSRCSLKLHVIDAWKDHMRTEKSFQRIIYVMRHAETHRCFNTWADVARHFSASLRVMRQKVRFWYENNCFRAWSKHKSFKLWTDKLLPRMLVRSNKDIMTSSFRDWVQELRQNRSMRKVFGKLYLTFLAKAFQAWCGLSSKNLLLSSRLSNVLTRWFFKSVRGCFNDWAHHVHLVEAMRTALGSLSNRGKAIAVKKTFCCWGTWTVRRRVLGRAMRKMMYRTRSRSFVQWTNLHNYKLLLIKHAEKALHRWVWRSVKGKSWTRVLLSVSNALPSQSYLCCKN